MQGPSDNEVQEQETQVNQEIQQIQVNQGNNDVDVNQQQFQAQKEYLRSIHGPIPQEATPYDKQIEEAENKCVLSTLKQLGAYKYTIDDEDSFLDCVTLEPYVCCLIYFRFSKMVPYILVNGGITKDVEGVSRFGQMDRFMKAVGKTINSEGDAYEGDWVDDSAQRFGIYYHNDGAKYEGEFFENQEQRELKLGQMVLLSKGLMLEGRRTEKESLYGAINPLTVAISRTIKWRDLENMCGQTGGNIKANGKTTKCTERVYLIGQMVKFTLGIMQMIKGRDMEYSNGLMENNTKDIGKMVNSMEKGHYMILMEN